MIKGKMCAVTKEAFKRFRVDHYHVQLTGVEMYINYNKYGGGGGSENSYLCKKQKKVIDR